MKFKIKNRRKPLNVDAAKSENVISSETEQVNVVKNKRKLPETEVEDNDIASVPKKSKKKKKQPVIEENNDAGEKQNSEITSENEIKDPEKKKKSRLVIGKQNTGEKQNGALANNSKKTKNSKAQDKLELESRTIFIGNLPVNFNGKKLQKLVSKFGEIETFRTRGAIPECDKISKRVAVNIKMFNKDQQCLVAYVLFKNALDALNALNLNGQVFEERHLRVTLPSEKTFDKNKGIFIGNLRYKITEEDIWDFFKDCGEISSVRIIRDKQTGFCKGFGYVNFKSEDSVEFALKLDEEKLQDREIRIKRLFSEGKLEKLKKKKELNAIKNYKPNKNFNSRKRPTSNDKSGFNKKFKSRGEKTPNEKSGFQKKFKSKTDKTNKDKLGFKTKKRNVNKVDLKKKKLAEKLMAKSKKKSVSS